MFDEPAIRVTFYAKVKHARRIQNLVKKYDGRFSRNPFLLSERALFEVTFEDGKNYKQFTIRTTILEQPYV